MDFKHAITVPLPGQTAVSAFHASLQLADAFAIGLPEDATTDPERLARCLFAGQPAWVGALMKLRDGIVGPLGLKTARQLNPTDQPPAVDRVGIFRIFERGDAEVVLGEDDRHLDFRVSVLCDRPVAGAARRLVVTTVVHCHNLSGRAYIAVIAPFHRRVVRATLERAARDGWPRGEAVAASSDVGRP